MTRRPNFDPAERNIQLIASIERAQRGHRTGIEIAVDRLAEWAGRPSFALVHAAGFALWIGYNALAPEPFDPYPFTLLTMVVSLEAILLTSFVLASQNRMAREADRRAKLDLHIDVLAEQELTAILRSIAALGKHAGIDIGAQVPGFSQMMSDTPVERLAKALDDGEIPPARSERV